MLKIHGVPFSAHTRKVIIAALEKDLPFELIPVVPLDPPEGWARLSPLGLIPVLQDGAVTVTDSSVINLYLEKRYPQRPFYPEDPTTYARALWIEEFVDGALARHVLHGVLLSKVFAPAFFGKPPDEALISASINEHIPPLLRYLEEELTDTWFAGSVFTIADVAVLSILLNLYYSGEDFGELNYPRLQAFLQRALERDSVRKSLAVEIPAAAGLGILDMSLLRRHGFDT